MPKINQRDYEILLIESNDEITDQIISLLNHQDLSISIAEAKSLLRAESLVKSEVINFVIFGPSLHKSDVLKFINDNKIGERLASIIFYFDKNIIDFDPNLKSLLTEFPTTKNMKDLFDLAKIEFNSKSPNNSTSSDSGSQMQLGRARQLGVIIERLATRLAKVSSEINKLPANTDIKEKSVSDAVNKVILGTTKLRKEKEDEDIKSLLKTIVKN